MNKWIVRIFAECIPKMNVLLLKYEGFEEVMKENPYNKKIVSVFL